MNKYYLRYSDDSNLKNSDKIRLEFVHARSEGLIPKVEFSGGWNQNGIFGRFDVEDNSILAECTEDMSEVWNDSCVEIFLKPENKVGHFCFEFNCIGKLYASYIKNETLVDNQFLESYLCSKQECSLVKRKSLLNEKVSPEKKERISWWIDFYLPHSILKKYFGEFSLEENSKFYMNFYKCGDKLQTPHWLSWNKIDELNFHKEKFFGEVILIR